MDALAWSPDGSRLAITLFNEPGPTQVALVPVGTGTRQPGRVLTIIGPGGMGKTRLAVEVGFRTAPLRPDGVWFVDLSAVREPSLVATNVLTTLGLIEEIGRSHTDTVALQFLAS